MFKIKIPVYFHNSNCKFESFGDWIDLKSSETVSYIGPLKEARTREVNFNEIFIDLGVSMKLPKGLEANIVPRSSTFKKFGLIQWNHYGVIDNEYCGIEDRWKFAGIPLRNGKIKEGDRICQFRINISQKATLWQKLKFLFCKVEFKPIDMYDYLKLVKDINRGGFGSTGK